MLRHQFFACHRPRQPPRFCSSTRSAASANVGTPSGAAFLREGIAAGPGQHAVGEGLLAGLGERDEGGGAESEFAPPAADDEPLDPAPGPGRLDEQVQAVAVSVGPGGAERMKAAESALSGRWPTAGLIVDRSQLTHKKGLMVIVVTALPSSFPSL